jgi:hypothetical protein
MLTDLERAESELLRLDPVAQDQYLVEHDIICRFCGHAPHAGTPCNRRFVNEPLYGALCTCFGGAMV